MFATASRDGTAKLWDIRTKGKFMNGGLSMRPSGTINVGKGLSVTAVSFETDPMILLTGDTSG